MSRRALGELLVWIAAAAALLVPLLASGCGPQQRGEPAVPAVVPETAQTRRGERLFHRFCYQCHPGGEAGLGPALNDKPLPGLAIRLQVREGIGDMPAFSPQLLSDSDVAAIVDYMELLRESPARPGQPAPPVAYTWRW